MAARRHSAQGPQPKSSEEEGCKSAQKARVEFLHFLSHYSWLPMNLQGNRAQSAKKNLARARCAGST